MSFKKYQKEVDDWISQYKLGYFQPFENLARLTEEVGELAREINHRFGPKKKKTTEEDKELGEEMADVIYPPSQKILSVAEGMNAKNLLRRDFSSAEARRRYHGR